MVSLASFVGANLTSCSSQEDSKENLLGRNMQVQFSSPDVFISRPQDAEVITKTKDIISSGKVKNEPQSFLEAHLEVTAASFKKQPPDNLRKSNFFHFDLSFYDANGGVIGIEKASFIGFQEDKDTEKPLRNGIRYKACFVNMNSKKCTEEILVRLIDSSTKKPISYEGQDKNPDMCRVLLTHEVMCSRCCESKSCGNRNETPSDPVLMNNNSVARFHMKCNQNCLKNAGNPRETRRFQVMIGFIRNNEICQLTTSENMFVHNNSKHGRRPSSICDSSLASSCGDISIKLPVIHQIIPKEGKLSGFDEMAIVGENFFEGIQVAFGNQISYKAEVLSSNVIKTITPPCNGPFSVEVKCVHNGRVFQRGVPLHFRYNNEIYDNQIDFFVERLWSLLPKQPNDVDRPTKDLILRRTIEVLECIYINGSIFYNNSYENGNTGTMNGMQNMIPNNSNGLVNGKDHKCNGVSKSAHNSENLIENVSNSTEYIRQSIINNTHQNYDNITNNQGYIMNPVVFGVNQIPDTITQNTQPNFYLPYHGPCETAPLAVNVGFPMKRGFQG